MERISENTDSTPLTSNPAMTTTTRLILCGTPPAETTRRTTTEAADYQTNDDPSKKMILDKQRKLLIYLGEDGQIKEFHVEDFVGLYPAWPIVEVALSPTGNAKSERMNMFVKCITALFGEILYVDDAACIGPLDITDDNKDNYISDKSKLPSNFTKLDKWIMISGGSWVFNKKEKGSSITIHSIDNLDAAETLRNSANGSKIARFSLRDMLYRIKMENGSPLFLQLSQRSSEEVDAVIPNTPEAELMAEHMNVQIAAWCHFYWKSTNPGGKKVLPKAIRPSVQPSIVT